MLRKPHLRGVSASENGPRAGKERGMATKFLMQPERWAVHAKTKKLRVSGRPLGINCSHNKDSACGGCYARLMIVLQLMVQPDRSPEEAKHLAMEVDAALSAEEAAQRLGAKE
jgi:hypothetical protein